jgi:acetyl esterase/lipase
MYPKKHNILQVMVIQATSVLLCLVNTQVFAAAAISQVLKNGDVVIESATLPLPKILSEGSLDVLKRIKPTEGPGAPVPLPSEVKDMAELRKIYNKNLQPNVDHMREVFAVNIEETTINGISAAIITPKAGISERNKNRLILNGPGGGFRTGVRANGLLISIPVAATLGVKVISILYRQAPEHKFPAGSEDLLKVWDEVTKTYKPQNIGMVGCSAGGALISQTTAMLIENGRPTPGALGVYCMGLGSSIEGDSRFWGNFSITNIAADMQPKPAVKLGPMSYFDGVDLNQFIVTPTMDPVKLAKFPPTIFFTGTRDFAMSGAAFGHRKLIEVGVESDLLIYDGLFHGFMTNPDFPESQEGYKSTAAFFDKYLGR